MHIIVCIDEKGGMAFNKRRQTRDKAVQEKILSLIQDHTLWMRAYSRELFPDVENIQITEDYLGRAQKHDYVFIEQEAFLPQKADSLLVFRWNRAYPADVYLGFEPEKQGFILQNTCEFSGTSHQKITLCIYEREVEEQ